MEVQDAGMQRGMLSSSRCSPEANTWDENAAQKPQKQPSENNQAPTRMTQDEWVLKG